MFRLQRASAQQPAKINTKLEGWTYFVEEHVSQHFLVVHQTQVLSFFYVYIGMGFQWRINIGFRQERESQIENFQSTCKMFPSSPVCTSMLSAGVTPRARLLGCSLTASRLQNVEWLASSQHCGYMPFFFPHHLCAARRCSALETPSSKTTRAMHQVKELKSVQKR